MRRWTEELSLDGKLVGVGIDRLDYTKGIPERFRYLDRLLELHPEYRGKLVFVQVAVPSRSNLLAYRQTESEIESLKSQINLRWGTSSYTPIVVLKQHCSQEQMIALHRLARFCVVSSLHDGMNLVAKEFVASRTDEDGVLVLSKFAGAARELKDALQINPFSIEEGAEACHLALTMTAEEQQSRMQRMRETVEQNNVYSWSGKLLSELVRMEFPKSLDQEGPEPLTRVPLPAARLGVAV